MRPITETEQSVMNEASRLTLAALTDGEVSPLGRATKETWVEWWTYFYTELLAHITEESANDPK